MLSNRGYSGIDYSGNQMKHMAMNIYVGTRGSRARSSLGHEVEVEGKNSQWQALLCLLEEMLEEGLPRGSVIYGTFTALVDKLAGAPLKPEAKDRSRIIKLRDGLELAEVSVQRSHLPADRHHEKVWGDLSQAAAQNKYR